MILIYKPNAKLQINAWIPEEAFRANSANGFCTTFNWNINLANRTAIAVTLLTNRSGCWLVVSDY